MDDIAREEQERGPMRCSPELTGHRADQVARGSAAIRPGESYRQRNQRRVIPVQHTEGRNPHRYREGEDPCARRACKPSAAVATRIIAAVMPVSSHVGRVSIQVMAAPKRSATPAASRTTIRIEKLLRGRSLIQYIEPRLGVPEFLEITAKETRTG
jgi:hypothetical protein